jgi:CheY-like chemotaxis protein
VSLFHIRAQVRGLNVDELKRLEEFRREAERAGERFVILCVDDEPNPLILRKLILEKAGFAVVPVESAARALDILQKQPVDLVLTDLLMPNMSGTDLAREVKTVRPDVPVVVFSGVNEVPPGAAQADLFLSKVEGPSILCERIRELLLKRRKAAV